MQRFCLIFSSVYCFLSLNEAARFHEMVTDSLKVKWIYVYAPIALLFFLYCVKVLCHGKHTRYLHKF